MHRKRIAESRLKYLLRQFPVVAILGPRQIGKSTLAEKTLSDFEYLDLEDPRDLARVRIDPMLTLSSFQKIIFDEAQRLPEIFPIIRSFSDRHPKNKTVLLGSASPQIITSISESLTGRVGFLELGGISIFEANEQNGIWIKGGFPRIHWSSPKVKPEEWYASYLKTFLEQDIPQLGFRVTANRLRQLLTMLAHSQGSVCNLSELGGSLGINYHSVSHILDIFEGTFIVRRLQPYFLNIKKRLVKSPKIYIRDTGLLHHLLGFEFAEKALLSHPKAGASFESFCIEQIINSLKLKDPNAEAYFYRTQTGVEVDLLLRIKSKLIPIEIKLGTTPRDLGNLQICMADLGVKEGYLLNQSKGVTEIKKGIFMLGLRDLISRLGL